jgi:hypothetical protein
VAGGTYKSMRQQPCVVACSGKRLNSGNNDHGETREWGTDDTKAGESVQQVMNSWWSRWMTARRRLGASTRVMQGTAALGGWWLDLGPHGRRCSDDERMTTTDGAATKLLGKDPRGG